MNKESLSLNLPESSVNKAMRATLMGNNRRRDQLALAQLSADQKADLPQTFDRVVETSNSLEQLLSKGLSLDYDLLNSLEGAKAQDIQAKIREAATLGKVLTNNELTEAGQLALNAFKQGLTEIQPLEFDHRRELIALSSILLALLLAGLLYTTADAAIPTVTPTPTEQVKSEDKNLIPTPTATPKKVEVPSATPTPEVKKETVVTSLTTTNLNARTGPGTSYDAEIVIPEGTEVVRLDEPQNGWVQISFELDGEEYGETKKLYVSVEFLTEPETTTITSEPQDEENDDEGNTTPSITNTGSITSTTVLTGEVDTGAVGGSVSPIVFDANGFPSAESVNGKIEAVKVLTVSEFQALPEIESEILLEELPKQVAIANSDGSFEVIKMSQGILENLKFAVTQEGIYTLIPVNAPRPVVMKWEGGIEHREDWVIPQFESQKVSIALSSAYNDIHPTREVILKGKKQYVFSLHNGTVAEAMASEERRTAYVNNSEYLAWYQEFSFIENEPTPIPYSPEYESSIKFDNLVDAMWDKLLPFQKNNLIHFPKLDKDVDITKKVNITVWRFPDDDEGKLGWNTDAVSPLPQHFYQINEEGLLTIHVSLARTSSHNLSAVISGAVSQMLVEEFDLKPDYMDQIKPMFEDINNSVFDLVTVDENNSSVIVLPIYVDAGEDQDGTWSKLE